MKKLKFFNIKRKKEKKREKSQGFRVKLFLSGYNLERWLNFLVENEIEIFSVVKHDVKNSEIEVSVSNEKRVEKFLKTKNIAVIKKQYSKLMRPIKFFQHRWGILVGIFACVCFFAIASNYVWKIEIMGNESYSSHQIQKVLSQNGVSFLSPLSSKTNDEIEKIVLDNFNNVSMVSVVKKGSSVVINIKEKQITTDLENLDKTQCLIATQDGVITQINLIQGTPLVKVGQTVRAGQPLVAPYVLDGAGNKISVEPKAEIMAEVWLSGQATVVKTKQIEQRTGKSVSERKMVFLNQEIVTSKTEVPFEFYDLEIREEVLGQGVVPIKYVTLTYFEVETKIVETDFNLVKDETIEKSKALAYAKVMEGDKIKAENHVITEKSGQTIVDYSVTVLRKICG